MNFIADIHIHSKYSRATSKRSDIEHLYYWAQLKGITVLGTGDFTHPAWFAELQEKLVPAEEGLYRLQPDLEGIWDERVPQACRGPVRFIIQGEISNIYKRNGAVRKVHNVVTAPDFESAGKIRSRLDRLGNIKSDGRPILGLDSRDLFEIVLESSDRSVLIPAHIWTPWFSVMGSKSGFDDIEECYGELTDNIFAVETGLSSDPPMNRRLSCLDRFTLVSNSDAHSPQKIGREGNIFNGELSYSGMMETLRTRKGWGGTIEFFPEEGKYHYDGHRKCSCRMSPAETLRKGGFCPVCGRKVTVGVMHRVEQLADREEKDIPKNASPYRSLIPLPEILSEILQTGVQSKRIRREFERALEKYGSELKMLLNPPIERFMENNESSLFIEAMRRIQANRVHLAPGYDGEYGTIKLFTEQEREEFSRQKQLFVFAGSEEKREIEVSEKNEMSGYKAFKREAAKDMEVNEVTEEAPKGTQLILGFISDSRKIEMTLNDLNEEQKRAVMQKSGPILIVAGPGAGKTRTLTRRIAYHVLKNYVRPKNVIAVTFTNKAAEEMRERLSSLLSHQAKIITVSTFHALCLKILKECSAPGGRAKNLLVYDDEDRRHIFKEIMAGQKKKSAARKLQSIMNEISRAKQNLELPGDIKEKNPELAEIYERYQQELQSAGVLDFDDLIFQTVMLLKKDESLLRRYRSQISMLCVDEYQDINRLQFILVKLLADKGESLCAIGDPDQSIYGFRGADSSYFDSFTNHFESAEVIVLTKTYRSSQNILSASGQVIQKNIRKNRITPQSTRPGGTRIDVHHSPTDKGEAEFVVHSIEKLMGGISHFSLDSGRVSGETETYGSFADFAVLYRIHSLGDCLEEAFIRSGMPYQRIGGKSLFAETEIKFMISCLRLSINPESRYDIARLLDGLFKGKQKSGISKLKECMLSNPGILTNLPLGIKKEFGLSDHSFQLLLHLSAIIGEAAKAGLNIKPVLLVENFISELISIIFPDTENQEAIEAFLDYSRSFDRIDGLLESASLASDIDSYERNAEKVSIMTLHASKGLEFPVVFITGCEKGLMPYEKPGKSDECDLNEERRLFYVGMTRAEDQLILSSSARRRLYGKTEKKEPSFFLQDIEQKLKNVRRHQYRKKAAQMKKIKMSRQLKLFDLE